MYEYFLTSRRNIYQPRKDGVTNIRRDRRSQKIVDYDTNIRRKRLPDPPIFMELTDCHFYKPSYGTKCSQFEREFIFSFCKQASQTVTYIRNYKALNVLNHPIRAFRTEFL